MNFTKILTALVLSGCTPMPQAFQSAEDVLDDTAIKIEISREAIQSNPDINVLVNIVNLSAKK